jgi:hypothetical protein
MPERVERWNWEKWVIGALSTIAAIFFSLYISSVQAQVARLDDDVKSQVARTLNHEQRLTTLEESKRNIEQLLAQIHKDLEDVKKAVVR